MSNIAPALQSLAVPIDSLILHPQNYRKGDVEAIRPMLRRFSQLKPVVVQESTRRIVAGNHTTKAAIEEGWTEIAAVLVDMPDEEAEAYLVADNRASDLATNDDAALGSILERLMLSGKLEGTGYNPDQVDDMLAAMDAMPEVEPEEFEGGHATSDEELAERFANRSQTPLRQFVLMYPAETATEVEGMFRKLERAWGVSGARDVVAEALRRACAEPPIEGLTAEEAERANIAPDESTTASEPVANAATEPTEDTPTGQVIYFTDAPDSNERIYVHPKCPAKDDGKGVIWKVPLDDAPDPTGQERECPECTENLPVQPYAAKPEEATA